MEKGALLPLRFYPATTWQDYHKLGVDAVIFREHHLYAPTFQLTLPDVGMHWAESDFSTIEIVNIETDAATDISSRIYESYSVAGEFRALVHFRFPITDGTVPIHPFDAGRYYVHISDGQTDWYSEVFELCDLGLDAFTNVIASNINFSFLSFAYTAADEHQNGVFCKTVAAGRASCYCNVNVFLGEELDLYADAVTYGGPPCGATDWNSSVFFELRTTTGLVVSNTVEVDGIGLHTLQLKAEVGGAVRLYMYVEETYTTKGEITLHLQRRYSDKNVQIRWSHPKNFCKIFYEDGYENVMFLDSKQVIDENAIEETVIEDDETNKYRIIGTNKKWNSLRIGSGEAMLNAMSLLRFHDNIMIYRETGEPIEVDEINLEQSVFDYEQAIIKLVYRERSCSVEACGFEVCCPTEGIPIMEWVVFNGIGNLPAAASWTDKYFIVEVTADNFRVYTSNGAAWSVDTTWDVDGDCLEARQSFNDQDFTPGRYENRFFWYRSAVTRWYRFIELASVADNANGTANVVSDVEYAGGLYLQAEYEDANGDWIACSTKTTTVALAGALTHVCACGVGTFNFRFHVWTDYCDYGYSNFITQMIT